MGWRDEDSILDQKYEKPPPLFFQNDILAPRYSENFPFPPVFQPLPTAVIRLSAGSGTVFAEMSPWTDLT